MRKEIYETPEIIMDKFETEDIMEVSTTGGPAHAFTKLNGDFVTDPVGFV